MSLCQAISGGVTALCRGVVSLFCVCACLCGWEDVAGLQGGSTASCLIVPFKSHSSYTWLLWQLLTHCVCPLSSLLDSLSLSLCLCYCVMILKQRFGLISGVIKNSQGCTWAWGKNATSDVPSRNNCISCVFIVQVVTCSGQNSLVNLRGKFYFIKSMSESTREQWNWSWGGQLF